MLAPDEIERLEKFDAGDARVLSVYVNVEPSLQVKRSYRVEFEDLVKEISGRLGEEDREALDREAERVLAWMDTQRGPQGLGLVVFSCAARDLWLADFLAVPVRNHIAFEPKPDVAGLLLLVDDYERYAVAAVSKDKARLFTVSAGEIEEIDSFTDFVPGRTAVGALRQSNMQRHHDAHVIWHLKKVVEHLATLDRRRNFSRLIVAGPEEATSALRDMLPHPLRTKLAAVIPADPDATLTEIQEKTDEIERGIEAEEDGQLVNRVLELAGAGGRATCGIIPTLEALWIGDVRSLVVADNARFSGGECTNCGRFDSDGATACPACGQPVRQVHDLCHRVMGRALEQRGSVHVVHGHAADRLSQAGNGIAAFLRFRWPAGVLESSIRSS